jgi:hypothetical protein
MKTTNDLPDPLNTSKLITDGFKDHVILDPDQTVNSHIEYIQKDLGSEEKNTKFSNLLNILSRQKKVEITESDHNVHDKNMIEELRARLAKSDSLIREM